MTVLPAPDRSSAPADAPANRFLNSLRRAGRGTPLIIAHRGDSYHAPENTLEAARLGFESGAEAWEFDVQLSRDGVPVVIHDESLARTTDVARRFRDDPRGGAGYLVSDFDLDEIRSLDAGSWFLAERGDPRSASGFGSLGRLTPGQVARYASGGVRVPTLRECLELTNELGWLANLELKSFPNPDPRLLDRVAAEVEALGAAGNLVASSFDHRDVARAATAGLSWATGVLTMTPLSQPGRYVREVVGADCYHPSAPCFGSASSRYLRRPLAENLQTSDLGPLTTSGVPALVYTVNDPGPGGLAVQLARAGVAGIFTDDPGSLRALFRSLPK